MRIENRDKENIRNREMVLDDENNEAPDEFVTIVKNELNDSFEPDPETYRSRKSKPRKKFSQKSKILIPPKSSLTTLEWFQSTLELFFRLRDMFLTTFDSQK